MPEKNVNIHFCPRFHVNFYHSYRGDTPDDNGFGKDIRIIRSILDDLDRLESEGILIKCAWDFDNAFTLGQILPQHAPDILERIRKRTQAGTDEIELMSWNNGLLTAHTEEELRTAISWAISAPDGSGVLQQFGGYAPIVRPQECMFTSEHIDVYRDLGVEAVSLYYSAIPFNGFGSFVPRMPAWKRYNPLRIINPRSGASMRLLPAINQGDIAEFFLSAARMLTSIRREQTADAQPRDMIVLLDMDADDSFWYGMSPGISRAILPSFGGLYTLMKSVAKLPFVVFGRPWDYLSTHPDVDELTLGQDIADGAFDGYASWAEKYENYEIWTMIAKAREAYEMGKRIARVGNVDIKSYSDAKSGPYLSNLPAELRNMGEKAIAERLRALSTTHFGMAAPVMNVSRLGSARTAATRALQLAEAFRDAAGRLPKDTGTTAASCHALSDTFEIRDNGVVTLCREGGGNLPCIEIAAPWVEYAGRTRTSEKISVTRQVESGYSPELRSCICRGSIPLSSSTAGPRVDWERTFSPAGQSLTRISMHVRYPGTEHRGYDRAKTRRLERTWDARWRQTAPLEITAFRNVSTDTAIHVIKEDFDGRRSRYALDYAGFGRNACLADINNHMTPHWIALSDGSNGILVAQDSPDFRGYSFCPLRQRIRGGRQDVLMFPFGSLWGPQYRYPARISGLGRIAAVLTADHLFSSAPSWEGKTLDTSLLVALYGGDMPPDTLLEEVRACSRS